jgi:hypothetical protein
LLKPFWGCNDTQHNDTQHKELLCLAHTQHKELLCLAHTQHKSAYVTVSIIMLCYFLSMAFYLPLSWVLIYRKKSTLLIFYLETQALLTQFQEIWPQLTVLGKFSYTTTIFIMTTFWQYLHLIPGTILITALIISDFAYNWFYL